MSLNKVPENLFGDLYLQTESNELGKSLGKKNLKDFIKEYPSYYLSDTKENSILHFYFISTNKKLILKIEKELIPKDFLESN